ncbi:MAG TPA: phage virion morphogenesis protein [Vampirovibrionales bacterium]
MIKISVDDAVSPAIAAIAKRCGDLTPAFKDFGEYYMGKIDEQFQREADPYNSSWTPLSRAYADSKNRQGHIPKILQRRGHMRAKTGYAASPGQLAIGFNDNKAKWHNEGTSRMPARPLFPDKRGLPQDAKDELSASLAAFLSP